MKQATVLSPEKLEQLYGKKQDVETTVEQVWGTEAKNYVLDIDTVPDPDWLVEGVVVRQGLTLIYGESYVGKTTFCLYMIDALRTGKQFFGRSTKKCKVLLAEQDQSPPILKKQKQKLGIPEKLFIAKIPLRWDNTKKKFNDDLPELLAILRPDVIIIDAYTSLGIEDINHPSAGLTFDALRLLSQDYNCAFVLIHHTNKTGTQMGSYLNIAKMDSVIALKNLASEISEKGKKHIEAVQEKLKADSCDNFKLTFNTDTLQMSLLSTKSCSEKVCEFRKEGKTVNEIIALLPTAKPETIRRYYRAN